MPRFRFQNINSIEKSPTSPAALQNRFTEILMNSSACRAKVESVNPTTGEYRIVLQGTLDIEENTPQSNL
jgi:hypothetical protein